MTNTSIFAADKSFDIKCPVIRWDDPNGYDLHPFGKYINRNMTHAQLQKEIKQFTVHWSVTYTAKAMLSVLKSRGLSCNFMIDDDVNDQGYATIYQCLDVSKGGYSQGPGLNGLGPGVEIAYMPQAWENPNLYSAANRARYGVQNHDTTTATVHQAKLKVFLPSDAQMKSLVQLMWGFAELFPEVPRKFPRNAQGLPLEGKLTDPKSYTGFAQHFHLRRSKIDAAGIDPINLEKQVQNRLKWGY
jgi:hypothetical protein